MEQQMKQTMSASEVLDTVLCRGEAQIVAQNLAVSPQYVRAWTRSAGKDKPTQTGRRNPLENIEAIVDVVIDSDGHVERARLIAQYVSHLCGGHHVPAPDLAEESFGEMLRHASVVLKETGEALEVTRAAWFDDSPGVFTRREKKICLKEVDEAIVALHQLRLWVGSR